MLKYYNSAYETIKSLMKYYGDSIGFQIKEGDFNSLVGSFEILQRNEELRYVIFIYIYILKKKKFTVI